MIFLGFGLGGVIMGRITDRLGIVTAMAVSIALLDDRLCAGGAFDRAVAIHRGYLS